MPNSRPPEEIMTTPLVRAWTHSRTMPGTVAMGVAITAISTGSPAVAVMLFRQGKPCRVSYLGLTGTTLPLYPPWMSCSSRLQPTLPSRPLAPIMAILAGLKKLSIALHRVGIDKGEY